MFIIVIFQGIMDKMDMDFKCFIEEKEFVYKDLGIGMVLNFIIVILKVKR